MSSWLLSGGTVVTMDATGAIHDPGAVLMRDGRLEYVGPEADCPAAPAARRLDTDGSIVIPGLINAHCHSPMTYLRGLAEHCTPEEWFRRISLPPGLFTPEDVYWSSLLGCGEMLRNGITCVADRYSFMDVAAQAIEQAGLRASLGPSIADDRLGSLEAALRLVQRYGVSGESRVSCGLAPVGPDTSSTELLNATRRAAGETGARLYIHVAQARHELRAVAERGFGGSVRYLSEIGFLGPDVVAAHCIYIDEEEIGILAQAGVQVALCPASNAKIEGRVAPVAAMRRAGLNLALGTDCAASNNGMDLLRELNVAGLLHRVEAADPIGPTSRELLAMATIDAARALGLERFTGSLEAGKRADVAVLDGKSLALQPAHDAYDRLVYSASGRDVTHVFVDGDLLVEDGRLARVNETEVLEHAAQWRRRLTSSAG